MTSKDFLLIPLPLYYCCARPGRTVARNETAPSAPSSISVTDVMPWRASSATCVAMLALLASDPTALPPGGGGAIGGAGGAGGAAEGVAGTQAQ